MVFGNLFAAWKLDVKTAMPRNVFFPGNIVEGVVHINASSPIEFTAVRLKICGKEKVRIRRTRTDSDGNTQEDIYASSTVVYKQLLTLAGEMKSYGSHNRHQMPSGTFYYPFSWQLPNDLPPSFSKKVTDDFAEIIYYVKAYVDIPMGRDAVSKSHFSVLRPMPQAQWVHRAPASVDRGFDVTCCCCISKGHVKAQIFMDRTVIAIDRDHLQIFANIDNSAGENPVESLEVCLMHTIEYRARGQVERHRYAAGREFIRQGVAAGERGTVSGVVPLPRNIVPTLSSPGVTSTYEVSIELNIPWASDPCQKFPVMIAQSVDETNYSPPMQFGQVSYRIYAKGECPEFYYQPPPQPIYQVQMIPQMAPPPQAHFLPPPQMAPVALPSANWMQGAPPMVQGQVVQSNAAGQQYQWSGGYGQPQHDNYAMGAPPPPQIAGYNAPAGVYGATDMAKELP